MARFQIMSDTFILYVVVCYLLHIGILMYKWSSFMGDEKIGGLISLLLAPISTPIAIGSYIAD